MMWTSHYRITFSEVKSFQKDLRVYHDHFFEDLIWHPVDPRRRIGFKPPICSLQFFESEKLFAMDHAGTSILSQEWLYMWKQTSHDVLDSIGIILAGGLSSRHQSLGNNFEGEITWVLLDLTDQVFAALKSAFLYALPQSWFYYFPCLVHQRITLWACESPPRCEAFLTQDRQLVVPPVHRFPGAPVPPAREHSETTFRLAARTVPSNDPADFAQPSSSMNLVSSRYFRSLSLLSRLVFQEGLLLVPPLSVFTGWLRSWMPNSMHWWSLTVITSRTHQSPILEARRGLAIVRSIINPPSVMHPGTKQSFRTICVAH